MSRDDYRPSPSQIHDHYRCSVCGREIEIESFSSAGSCECGGQFQKTGESYPGDPGEWDEQRDPDGEWRPRRY
jgi:hypothetical protein